MEEYRKMYSILCAAVDSVIEPLERVAEAAPWTAVLRKALLDAEEIYIESSEQDEENAEHWDRCGTL